MIKEKNRKALRYIVYVPVVLLTFILQAMVFSRLEIFGIKPFIFPVMVAGIALFEGKEHGAAIGLICGVLCDVSFDQPVMVFTVVMTLVGVIIGLLGDMFLSHTFVSYGLCALLALLLCGLVQVVQILLTGGGAGASLFGVMLAQTLVSMLFTIPCWYISLLVNKTLRD